MPIMKACCCCRVRAGCIFSGIFSMVTSLSWAAWGVYNLFDSGLLQTESVSDVPPFYYGYAVGVGLWLFLCITSFFMVAGVCCDRRGLLIPYIVADVLVILVQCVLCAFYLYIMIQVFEDGYLYNLVNLIALSMAAVFVVLYSLSLLCVISRYQELRYGEDARVIRQESFIPVQSAAFGMTSRNESRRY
ncbi:uncharacterized protein LOC117293981 [Asterias rubens]|uniref:uncharacterized protein LOC117293981 n=1 Tax=Asterias rubens TaxID=7604 RepID=UPI001455C3EB|nr:uncharacterized protein LOC117293981 [Asterias rubens]